MTGLGGLTEPLIALQAFQSAASTQRPAGMKNGHMFYYSSLVCLIAVFKTLPSVSVMWKQVLGYCLHRTSRRRKHFMSKSLSHALPAILGCQDVPPSYPSWIPRIVVPYLELSSNPTNYVTWGKWLICSPVSFSIKRGAGNKAPPVSALTLFGAGATANVGRARWQRCLGCVVLAGRIHAIIHRNHRCTEELITSLKDVSCIKSKSDFSKWLHGIEGKCCCSYLARKKKVTKRWNPLSMLSFMVS